MFDTLSERLSGTFRKLTGKAVLSEDNIQEALREVRRALLEADVALAHAHEDADDGGQEDNPERGPQDVVDHGPSGVE